MSFHIEPYAGHDTVLPVSGEGLPMDDDDREDGKARPRARGSSIERVPGSPVNSEKRRRFDALVAPHMSAIRARAGQLCRSYFDTEDLVQSALERAFVASDQLSDPSRARAWVLAIVTHKFLDSVRQRRRRPDHVDLDLELAAPEPAEPAPWDGIGTEELRAAIEQLPDDLRETYRLFALEGCDYVAIAQAQGIPKATVGTRLFRARKLLRGLLTAAAAPAPSRPRPRVSR